MGKPTLADVRRWAHDTRILSPGPFADLATERGDLASAYLALEEAARPFALCRRAVVGLERCGTTNTTGTCGGCRLAAALLEEET